MSPRYVVLRYDPAWYYVRDHVGLEHVNNVELGDALLNTVVGYFVGKNTAFQADITHLLQHHPSRTRVINDGEILTEAFNLIEKCTRLHLPFHNPMRLDHRLSMDAVVKHPLAAACLRLSLEQYLAFTQNVPLFSSSVAMSSSS